METSELPFEVFPYFPLIFILFHLPRVGMRLGMEQVGLCRHLCHRSGHEPRARGPKSATRGRRVFLAAAVSAPPLHLTFPHQGGNGGEERTFCCLPHVAKVSGCMHMCMYYNYVGTWGEFYSCIYAFVM